jgi:hypothetical protein
VQWWDKGDLVCATTRPPEEYERSVWCLLWQRYPRTDLSRSIPGSFLWLCRYYYCWMISEGRRQHYLLSTFIDFWLDWVSGGIGPQTIDSVLSGVREVSERTGKSVWIDMESSLRTIALAKDGTQEDLFSIEKCFQCVLAGVRSGLPTSRFTLLSIWRSSLWLMIVDIACLDMQYLNLMMAFSLYFYRIKRMTSENVCLQLLQLIRSSYSSTADAMLLNCSHDAPCWYYY